MALFCLILINIVCLFFRFEHTFLRILICLSEFVCVNVDNFGERVCVCRCFPLCVLECVCVCVWKDERKGWGKKEKEREGENVWMAL
jgi:hypothetical protein